MAVISTGNALKVESDGFEGEVERPRDMIFLFDTYSLDTGKRTLMRGETPVVLTPKVFQTLSVLVENRERVLSKDELCQLIWPDQFVEDANLTQNISVLRRALDDLETGKKYIATFHGHGYRFVEPVSVGPAPKTSPEEPRAQVPPAVVPAGRPIRSYWLTPVSLLLLAAAGFAALRMHSKTQAPVPTVPAAGEVETLTRLAGAQVEPAWSPDASSFAFINMDATTGSSAVYIQKQADLQPLVIASGGGEFNSPTWSPDGKTLAFVHLQGKQSSVMLFDLITAHTKSLTPLFPTRYRLQYRHLDWSPDGSLLVVDDKPSDAEPLSLYLIYIKNGEKTRLTFPDMDIIGDLAPRFSPDGSEIAFVRVKYQGQNDVITVPTTSGQVNRLVETTEQISDVGWENNHSLLYAARLDAQYRFWRRDVHTLNKAPELAVQFGSDLPIQFSISPQSKKVAFSAYSANLNIWSMQTHGETSWKPVIVTPGQDVSPAYSPDGKKIAFRSDYGGREQIWISDSSGSNAHKLGTGELVPAVHAWDHDGDKVLFKPRNGSGLYSVTVTGKPAINLLTTNEVSHPAVSVDGKSIFARKGHFIYRLDRTTNLMQKLTSLGGAPMTQSSDGKYLYFAQGRMDGKISRLDLQTLEQVVVISSLLPGYSESWAVTSDGLYYLGQQSGIPTVFFHEFASGKEHAISPFRGDLPPVGDSGFAVSPDGAEMLVVRGEVVVSNIRDLQMQPAR